MNKPHKWHKEIKHWADGGEIQYRETATLTFNPLKEPEWKDFSKSMLRNPFFPSYTEEWRIKPKTLRYRVALEKDGSMDYFVVSANNEEEEKDIENESHFIKWLTDWQEIEI